MVKGVAVHELIIETLGYGQSTTGGPVEDYSLECVNQKMLSLLSHCGYESAVWIGKLSHVRIGSN